MCQNCNRNHFRAERLLSATRCPLLVGRTIQIALTALNETLTLSLIGGIIGTAAGVATSAIISSASGWPIVVSPLSIVLAFGFSGFIGIFFGFYPAYKASLLNPIDALRYE
jgi:putative ABC transport system permease protein